MCCRRWQTRRRCRQVARSAWNALKAEGGRECEKARTRIEPHSRLLALNPPLAFHAFQRPAPPPPQLRPGILLETLLLPPLAAPPLFVPPAGDLPGEVAVAEPEGEPGGQGNGAQDEGEGGGDDLLGDADLLDRHEDRDEDHRGLGEFGEGRDPFHRAGGGEDEPAHELAEDDAEDDDDDPGDERRDEAEHHLEHLADALEAEGGAGEEDHHQHHEPEDQAADRAHRVDAAARRAAERGGEPAPFRGAVEVELVEGAVDEALHLAGQQVAGREDHEGHDERGEDPAQGIEGLAQPFHEFGHVVTSMASLPAWAPEWRRRKASMARSSGTTVSITGRRSPCCASAATARYSERLPIVDPRIDHWCQKRRRRSNEAAGPLVAPQLTTRPPRARERSDRSQVASPTLSTTTWHPFRPVSRFTSATTSAVEWSSTSSAPSRRARASLSAVELVAMTHAPRCFAIPMHICATPPPAPHTRTVSPARSRARLTIIRHAVSAARENPAASVHDHPAGRGARFTAGSWTNSAALPWRCSPRIW